MNDDLSDDALLLLVVKADNALFAAGEDIRQRQFNVPRVVMQQPERRAGTERQANRKQGSRCKDNRERDSTCGQSQRHHRRLARAGCDQHSRRHRRTECQSHPHAAASCLAPNISSKAARSSQRLAGEHGT
jgi:hypothetical protein